VKTPNQIVECAGFRAVFSPRGSLLSLEPERGGRKALDLPPHGSFSPFRILRRPLSRAGGGTTYSLENFAMRLAGAGGPGLVYEGESQDGTLCVTESARCSPSGDLEWSLRVRNMKGHPVWLVAFPILRGLDLGPGQRVTIPHNAGFVLDPLELDDDEEIFLNYPVHASMQWLDLFARDRGLYLGVHDPLPYVKQFAVRRDGRRVRLEWRYPDVLLRAGEEWEVPAATVAPHRGDWRVGARRYRAWAEGAITFPEAPRWFSRLPAWSWISGKGNHAARPERVFSDLPGISSVLRKETGVPVIQLAGWMEHGHDTHYPDYRAGKCMGGPRELKLAIERIHADAGRISLYTNGRLIDPEGSIGAVEGWQDWCVRLAPCSRKNAGHFTGTFTGRNEWDSRGDIAKEKYGRTLFAVGCPHDSRWRNLFIDRMLSVVRTYPADGIYIDQVCGATSLPCYAEGHGHRRPNLAWRGYIEFLGELRDSLRSARPEIYLATEGVGDVFGAFFDAQQAHNDWTAQIRGKGEDMCELFRYTFPESLVLIGPTGSGKEEYLRLGAAVAGGFDCFSVFPHHSDASFRRFMKETFSLRARIAGYVRGAQPVAGVSAGSRHTRVFGLEGPGHVVVTGAWLGSGAPRSCTVRFRPLGEPGFRRAQLVSGNRGSLEWTESNGKVGFRTPGTKIFAARFRR